MAFSAVAAVEIHERHAGDTPQLPPLIDETAKNFKISESGDKAYASVDNSNAIDRLNATPYIAFKSHHRAIRRAVSEGVSFLPLQARRISGALSRAEQCEWTVSIINAKFRHEVRSKKEVAMKNDVLCKILCRNICCLIIAIYELGIQAMFGLSVA